MKKNWRLLMEAAHPPKNLQSDLREPAWSPARAVSAAEMPIFLIEIVPLELQRRIVNDLTKHRNFSLIIPAPFCCRAESSSS
jgi:hypothetical protein